MKPKPTKFIAFTWPTNEFFFPVAGLDGRDLGNLLYKPRCFETLSPRRIQVGINHNFDLPKLTAELWHRDEALYGCIRFPDVNYAVSIQASFHRGEFAAVSPTSDIIKSNFVKLDNGDSYTAVEESEIVSIALVKCSANSHKNSRAWIQSYDFNVDCPMHISPPLLEAYYATFLSDPIRASYAKSLAIQNR